MYFNKSIVYVSVFKYDLYYYDTYDETCVNIKCFHGWAVHVGAAGKSNVGVSKV
jgi:hypothetical protein